MPPLTWTAARDKTDLGERLRGSAKPAAPSARSHPTGTTNLAVEPGGGENRRGRAQNVGPRQSRNDRKHPSICPNPPMDLDRTNRKYVQRRAISDYGHRQPSTPLKGERDEVPHQEESSF